MNIFQKLEQELIQLPTTANERSLYTSLNNFLSSFANEARKTDSYTSVSEESGYAEDKHIGFPDLTLRSKGHAAGWVEVKNPGEKLDSSKHSKQFTRYKNSFENLIITNLKEWQLWQWDSEGKSVKIKSIDWDAYHQKKHDSKAISDLLNRFLEGTAHEVRTPKQLAIALARKTQVLRDQVKESYKQAEDDSQLVKLKDTFEDTLIQNISDHQFANMVAETIAYSLFLARLEYEEKHNGKDFNVEIVRSFLPKNVPVLRDLYEIILRVSQEIPPIDQAVGLLVDQLNAADIERIRHKLTDHKAGEDPVIQFYEPFLSAYDPIEREARGVYYTPKPLVDFIVRGVDHILKTRFYKEEGLADDTVQILDPATGSGTFLMSAIQQVHYNLKQSYGGLGDEELKRRFQQTVLRHILKHFYGFELLMAPYAVAHLKLTLELERMGFNWPLTALDDDDDNNRLKIYLANSLDDPNQPLKLDLPGFHLAEESNKAQEIKRDAQILALIGNPPYSGVSMNLQPEMRALVEHFKYVDGKKIKERGALQFEKNINDDYVKFIAFAQKIINDRNAGVIAYVTNNGYISNPTLRGLRKSLLDTFEEILVLNLHGDRYSKPSDDDESVFNIQKGTSVIFLIKNPFQETKSKSLSYSEIIGKRGYKLQKLSELDFVEAGWRTQTISGPYYYFNQELKSKSVSDDNEYFSIDEIFEQHGAGIISARDEFATDNNKNELENRIRSFAASELGDKDVAYEQWKIRKKKGWDIYKSQKQLRVELSKSEDNIAIPYTHKLFDNRFISYYNPVVWSMSRPTMSNFINRRNIGLVVPKQLTSSERPGAFVTSNVGSHKIVSAYNVNHYFPLFIYSRPIETNGMLFKHEQEPKPNFNTVIVNKFSKLLGQKLKQSSGMHAFTPISLFDYIYAVLNWRLYLDEHIDEFRRNFPKIPMPKNKKMFWKLALLGGQLRELHLMGNDPFGTEPELLSDSHKWGIYPKGQRDGSLDWKVENIEYDGSTKVFINDKQYFEGIEPEVWEFYIGGYQVMDKWLKDRKKSGSQLSADDRLHYVKIAVVLRETIRIQKEIDATGFMELIESP